MKKLILSLGLVLTVLFISAPSVNAAERKIVDPSTRFDAQIAKMTENHVTKIAEATERFEENKAKAQDKRCIILKLNDLQQCLCRQNTITGISSLSLSIALSLLSAMICFRR